MWVFEILLFSFFSTDFFLVPAGQTKYYKSPFLRDFWHLNVAMMTSNNALIPDPDKEDILASKPFDWPFLHLGLRMCGWGDTQLKYYLIGTPVIWWAGTISLVVAIGTWVVYMLRRQRKYQDMSEGEWEHFMYVGKVAFFGWLFHFGEYFHKDFFEWVYWWIWPLYIAPFMIMGRVTYIHHYVLTSLVLDSMFLISLYSCRRYTSRSWCLRTFWIISCFLLEGCRSVRRCSCLVM